MDFLPNVPSWDQIERNLERSFRHVTRAASRRVYSGLDQAYGQLGGRRIDAVRRAMHLSSSILLANLKTRWANIGIEQVLDVLLSVAKEVTLILGGSTALGSMLGGVAGAAAFGIGAAPGAVAGAGIGLQVGNLILATLGLTAIAGYFYMGLPACMHTLREGFAMAWNTEHGGPSGAMDPTGGSGSHSRSEAHLEAAARMLARGQEQLVALVLMSIAAYLLRGALKASINAPLDSIAARSAALQAQITDKRLAQWLARNQQALLAEAQSGPSPMLAEQQRGAPQKLVAKKPEPKPTVTEADNSFEAIYARAGGAKSEIDEVADRLAARYGGIVAKAPIKSAQRALEKINADYGGDASRIKDLARNTIIVDDSKITRVVDDLRALGAKVKVIDGGSDALGYSGVNSSLMTRAGIAGEIQVNSPAMIYAKEPEALARNLLGNDLYDAIAGQTPAPGGLGHGFYEQWRVLDSDSPVASAIADQSKTYYNAVREANAR